MKNIRFSESEIATAIKKRELGLRSHRFVKNWESAMLSLQLESKLSDIEVKDVKKMKGHKPVLTLE